MNEKPTHLLKEDSLVNKIYKTVEENLVIDPKAENRFIWLNVIICFSLTVLCYFALFKINNSLLFIFCFISYGFISLLFAFNLAHEFSHDTIFKNEKLNNFFFIVIFSLIGAHAESWKTKHINTHHYAPNVEGLDADLKLTKLIRVLPTSKHYWFNKYQHWYTPFLYTIYSLVWIFFKDVVILYSKEKHIKHKGLQYHLSFWLQKTFYCGTLILLPILFSQQSWQLVIIGFLLMHVCQSSILIYVIVISHHVEAVDYPTTDLEGNINTSWHLNQIKSSNDFYPFSNFANFIFGGFNNHITHHLFPHTHHYYYPQINMILYDILLKENIKPNQTTLFGGIVSHLKLLKRMSYKR